MIEIREAKTTDISGIQALYRELDRHHVELLPHIFQPVEGDIRSDEAIADWIHADDRTYWVATSHDSIIGFVSVAEKSYGSFPMHVPQRYGLVDEAIMASDYRGRGIGLTLFDASLAWMQARGLESAQVQVWNQNAAAIRFYRNQGFTPLYTRMQMDIHTAQLDAKGGSDG